jgi:hypothetical protein
MVYLYEVNNLSPGSQPASIGGVGTFNLPQNAIVSHGSLFIADTGFNRVHIWQRAADAYSGKTADVILNTGGQEYPAIGQDSLFWPLGRL